MKLINSSINEKNIIKKELVDKVNNEENKKIKIGENKQLKKEINKKINNKKLNNKKINNRVNEVKKINSKNSIFNQKTLPINNLFYSENDIPKQNSETICILGTNGIGKSVFSILFAQSMKNKKSIIIDFDVLNQSLHTLLGIKNYDEKIKKGIKQNNLINHNQDFKKYIIKNNTKIDLLSGMNLILDSKYKLSNKKIRRINEQLKEDYDIIIFDTASENFLEYTREIINFSDQVIFISGANLLEIKKSKKMLEIYNKEWGINNNKINIIFNKCTNKSIDENILKEVFRKYNILGKIQLNDYYDLLINKNTTYKSKLHKEIENIKKQIIKEKYYGIS